MKWALRMPDPHGGGQGEIELRQVYDVEDFMDHRDILAREVLLREQLEKQNQS